MLLLYVNICINTTWQCSSQHTMSHGCNASVVGSCVLVRVFRVELNLAVIPCQGVLLLLCCRLRSRLIFGSAAAAANQQC
jgi:hypothetical protein